MLSSVRSVRSGLTNPHIQTGTIPVKTTGFLTGPVGVEQTLPVR